VAKPAEWPGPNCVAALTNGELLRGTWFNRSAEYAARQRGKSVLPLQFATTFDVKLTPLPLMNDDLALNMSQAPHSPRAPRSGLAGPATTALPPLRRLGPSLAAAGISTNGDLGPRPPPFQGNSLKTLEDAGTTYPWGFSRKLWHLPRGIVWDSFGRVGGCR